MNMSELTDEDIEVLKHRDFRNKKHEKDCTCGYCEILKWFVKNVEYRNMENKKIVCWESKITGIKGHGNPLPADLADIWVKYGNKNFPDIEHNTIDV
jgi:hypothetical protein